MPESKGYLSSRDAVQDLLGFLHGDRGAADNLVRAGRGDLHRLAASVAPDLPPDLIPEVVSEALTALSDGPPPFAPSRGNARSYLRYAMQNGAKRVRAGYAPPGSRTRLRGTSKAPDRNLHLDIEAVPDRFMPRFVRLPETLVAAKEVFEKSPEAVQAMLDRVVAGDSLNEVAHALGRSRHAIARAIRRFAQTVAA